MRVVSLLPSSTEIVHVLGAEGDLVGISHECDHPASVRGLPVLTSSKIDITQLSADIDRDVRWISDPSCHLAEPRISGVG